MIRERQLRDAKLTLEETERLCCANELAQQHAKTFNEASAMAIHDSAKVAVVKNKTMKKNTPQKKEKMMQHSPANVMLADMSPGSALPMAKDV